MSNDSWLLQYAFWQCTFYRTQNLYLLCGYNKAVWKYIWHNYIYLIVSTLLLCIASPSDIVLTQTRQISHPQWVTHFWHDFLTHNALCCFTWRYDKTQIADYQKVDQCVGHFTNSLTTPKSSLFVDSHCRRRSCLTCPFKNAIPESDTMVHLIFIITGVQLKQTNSLTPFSRTAPDFCWIPSSSLRDVGESQVRYSSTFTCALRWFATETRVRYERYLLFS